MKEGFKVQAPNSNDIPLMVLRAREDDEVFSQLLALYTPLINKLISGFEGSLLSYDEAFAEACVAFHRALSSYDLSRSKEITFGLYSRICIYRRLCEFVAKRSREAEIPFVDPDQYSSADDIEEKLLTRERIESYLKIVRELLSKFEYSVFSLYVDGYSTREIASILSKNEKSVDNAKARAFKRLRDAGGILAKFLN